jgi:hypothetical protein
MTVTIERLIDVEPAQLAVPVAESARVFRTRADVADCTHVQDLTCAA